MFISLHRPILDIENTLAIRVIKCSHGCVHAGVHTHMCIRF